MFPSLALIRAAHVIATVAGWALTRRRPAHLPAALALTALLALDAAHHCARGHVPRLADDALFLAAYAAQAALALRVLLPLPLRLPLWLALPGAGLAAALVAIASGVARRPIYAAAFDASLAIQVVAVAAYVLRRPREEPASQHGVALLLAASAVADVLGPWRAAHPDRDWHEGAWTALLTWAMIAGWEVWQWSVQSPRSSS